MNFSKPINYTILTVNPKVNYGLRVFVMCRCESILRKKMSHSGDVDNGGAV